MFKFFILFSSLAFLTLSSCETSTSTKTTTEPFDERSVVLSLSAILNGEKFSNTNFRIEKNALNNAYAERYKENSRQKTKISISSGSNSFQFFIVGDKVGEYYFSSGLDEGVAARFTTKLNYNTTTFYGDYYSGKVIIDTYDVKNKVISGRFYGTFSTYDPLEIKVTEGKFFVDNIE